MALLSFFAVFAFVFSVQALLEGIDISGHTTNVNFQTVKANGIKFVYIKATEGTCKHHYFAARLKPGSSRDCLRTLAFKSDLFNSQYTGATNAGLIRGAYHFARPDVSSGATQANYFASNGGKAAFVVSDVSQYHANPNLGGWSADGITLPGVLDVESTYIVALLQNGASHEPFHR